MLNFLKELPDRYILVVCFFAMIAFYFAVRSDAVLQLLINFAVAIIALSTKIPKAAQSVDTAVATTISGDIVSPEIKDRKSNKGD